MFVISEIKNTFEWPVKARIPNRGSWRERAFTGIFNLLPQSRVDEIIAAYRGDPDDVPEDLSAEIFAGWNEAEVQGSDGVQLAVTDENRETLLQIIYVRTAVVRAYFEAVGGRKARLGN